jgi:hypothetical protein
MWTFKMYSRNTKTTNEPTASNNKSDRLQVNIWDTWKTLKYLNINDSFHLKELEISKYKRESLKARIHKYVYLWEKITESDYWFSVIFILWNVCRLLCTNVNGQHIGESDYWFSVTARLPWSFKSTLLANQNSTCHENIR